MSTLEITLCVLLPFLFSVFNKFRGGSWPIEVPVLSITKTFDIVMGAVIGLGMVNLLNIDY